MKPLISVIVPVYNAGLSIEKCAKSILTQTFSNLELILIDDGSTDNSLFICRSLASQDARITVRHQSNQGVSKARNLGISISKGEWIAFVDADDYLYEYYLSGLLMQTTDCELVIGGYNKVLLSEKKEFPGVLFPEMVLSKSNVDCQEIWDKVLLYGTPWGKLFKSSLIKENNIGSVVAGNAGTIGTLVSAANAQVQEEAIAALTMLGFAQAPSQKVVLAILKEEPSAPVEQVIKLALKRL